MKAKQPSSTLSHKVSWIRKAVLISLFVLCSIIVISSTLATFSEPKFDKDIIRKIAERAVDLPREEAFHNVSKELQAAFPQLIYNSDLEWIFINAGGWMGSFCLLHASLTEYVLLFGTAIETAGHSGRYWIDIYDTLLRGTFQQWSEGTTHYVTYSAGDTIYHPRLSATAVCWKEDTWMLEYAHGPIMTSLLFALSDSLFSTQDWLTIYKSIQMYGKMVIQSFIRFQV
ncbi:C-8 sterol isomerase [Galdieria sulphuraria]|uniref:C-8 sterol isomerase n=1 Tax=Galdieria sulphuraria TaxID=130081 RepID=M2XJ37_GALSU|nr:C-8 sterol isomerase [Galdieria sulphuraria]EME30122.1 C-8 sterol isomerase [Galdieria sulphuraria]|eukprot:XP_005706642.1 C-8 sterol isomerase [Galdieria sulphuraria]